MQAATPGIPYQPLTSRGIRDEDNTESPPTAARCSLRMAKNSSEIVSTQRAMHDSGRP